MLPAQISIISRREVGQSGKNTLYSILFNISLEALCSITARTKTKTHLQDFKSSSGQSGVCFVDVQSNLDVVVSVMGAVNDA